MLSFQSGVLFLSTTSLKSNDFVLLRFCLQAVCSTDVLRQSLPRSQYSCLDRPAGVEHHVAETTALSIKELRCSVFPERRRMFVQDSLPFFIAKIVNATTPYDGTVIAAAHILLLRLHESHRFAGAASSGHLRVFHRCARTASSCISFHQRICILECNVSKFTVDEVMGCTSASLTIIRVGCGYSGR